MTELINQKSVLTANLPLVMGIVNITPDSFSDGGRFVNSETMKLRVSEMVSAGADIMDIGGESTRPGAIAVGLQEELDRVIPVIEFITQNFATPVSIDTYKTVVMQEAIKAGAKIVNDVNALRSDGAMAVVANSGTAVCLMHKQGSPATMQQAPQYQDVVHDVVGFLKQRADLCVLAGIDATNIILDPGFGFGKNLLHNVALFERLDELVELNYPVLVGVSRKSMIGQLMHDAPVEERMVGSVVAALLAALKGAKILRVHDVKETVQALEVAFKLV